MLEPLLALFRLFFSIFCIFASFVIFVKVEDGSDEARASLHTLFLLLFAFVLSFMLYKVLA